MTENVLKPQSLHLDRDSHFLEEVPVCDDLQLLQDEEDPAADEEGLVFGQSLIQQQQVPLADNTRLPEVT